VRKYDEDIGRFTSIDQMWEKEYSWSPYHYCSNNPVMGSDPVGDSVDVSYIMEDLDDAKMAQSINERFKNSTGLPADMYSLLEKSTELFTIVFSDHGNSHYNPSENKMWVNIYQSFSEDEIAPITILFGHEMGHAVRDLLGLRENPNNKNENGVKCEEVLNIEQYENVLRLYFMEDCLNEGCPIVRTIYSGKNINE
jgi:hypothetical protein